MALVAACNRTSSSESRADAAAPAPSAGRCEVAFHCPGGACRDYDDDVKSTRASVEEQCVGLKDCAATKGVIAEVGRCGSARYTKYADKYGSQIYWYDDAGKPFALRRTDPFDIYCGQQSKEENAGPVPTCTLERTENLVPKHY